MSKQIYLTVQETFVAISLFRKIIMYHFYQNSNFVKVAKNRMFNSNRQNNYTNIFTYSFHFRFLYNTTYYDQLTMKQNSTKHSRIYFKMQYGYVTTPLKKGVDLTDWSGYIHLPSWFFGICYSSFDETFPWRTVFPEK